MLDKMAISKRFFLCFPGMSRSAMAQILGVRRSTVTEWASKGSVPWSKLKYLSDSQAVSWDWILQNMEPKDSQKAATPPDSTIPEFDSKGITQRFLSLFQGMTQTQIAAALSVTTSTVSDWKLNRRKVGWERLDDAVAAFGIRWDWLIDGLQPRYRERQE